MRAWLILAAVVLTGCGARQPLRPAAGEALPVKPDGAPAQPQVAELLTPTQQARPVRSDELLRQSQTRPDDRFDLPPP